MKSSIPYGRQFIDRKDIISVQKSLTDEKITTGELVEKFEKNINKFLKCKYSISCNSGTSALFLAFKAINLKKNDKVIMPSINFVSSYNIAKLFGAKVFLADVDRLTGQMTPSDVDDCCKKFKLKNIKALVVMYNAGYPQNADKFYKLKAKYGFKIIEDACHALGAEYIYKKKKFRIGSCKHCDISTFSMHPLKTITTGEGGILTFNKKEYYNKVLKLRSHGIEKKKNTHWKYDVVYNSLNFRLTDFQCALGISQLKKIKKFVNRRKKIFDFYKNKLKKNKNLSLPIHNKNYVSSHHLFLINIKKFNLKKKDNFFNYMKAKKIILQYHYIPVFYFKIFKDNFIGKKSKIYYNTTLSLPIYYSLTNKKLNYIVKNINNFFKIDE
jgi:UDP-4-amino-4,6-dideoxy-L-N-acetyl-beta-L-altrosamine transaminase